MKNSLIKNLDLMKMRYKKAITSRVFTKPLQRVQEEYLKIDISVKALQNAIGLKLKDTKSNLPTSLPMGEVAFANDTEELYLVVIAFLKKKEML